MKHSNKIFYIAFSDIFIVNLPWVLLRYGGQTNSNQTYHTCYKMQVYPTRTLLWNSINIFSEKKNILPTQGFKPSTLRFEFSVLGISHPNSFFEFIRNNAFKAFQYMQEFVEQVWIFTQATLIALATGNSQRSRIFFKVLPWLGLEPSSQQHFEPLSVVSYIIRTVGNWTFDQAMKKR